MGDTLFWSSLIDPPLWDKARWTATFFMTAPDGSLPPKVGLVFRERTPATAIFQSWAKTFGGLDDKEDFLYLSFVEGELRGEQPGYSIVIGVDRKVATRHAHANGLELPDLGQFYRTHRMETNDTSNLRVFKTAFEKHGHYGLTMGVLAPDGRSVRYPGTDAIKKRVVHFKRAELIDKKRDPEAVLWGKPIPRFDQ